MHFRFIVIEFLFKNLARRYMLINDKFFSQLLINHRLTPFMQNVKAIESVLYCRSNDKNHSSFNTNWEECNQIKEHTAEDSHLAYFDRAAAPLRPMGHRAILKSNIHLRSSTSFKISQEVGENNDRRNNIKLYYFALQLRKSAEICWTKWSSKAFNIKYLIKTLLPPKLWHLSDVGTWAWFQVSKNFNLFLQPVICAISFFSYLFFSIPLFTFKQLSKCTDRIWI